MSYGYTLTAAGRTLLLQLQAGNSMTISRIAVGDGEVPDGTNPATLTNLVHEVGRSQATCTVPVVEADTLSFEIEYRNKWDEGTFGENYTDPTGLTEGFWLKEYAVFALDANENEVMLYYANLGDFPEPVARWNGRNLVSKRYPVSISIVDDNTDIQLAFPARAFITSDYLEQRLASYIGTASKLETARTIDGIDFDGSAAISHFETCSTAAATAAKAVSITGFKLAIGAKITVKFTVTNTAANPTLNVNSTGAKSIFYKGAAVPTGLLVANSFYDFIYDGTNWQLTGVELGTAINSTTEKTTLVDADMVPLIDSAASNAMKKITWTNIKNAVKSFIYGMYHGYVTCSTAAGTTAKTVTLSGFTLETGASVKIKFTNVNTAANSTLNVNSTGAKPIYYKGIAIQPEILSANVVYEFVYNGTQYDLIGVPDVYTKTEIETQLNNKENSIKDAAAKTTPMDADALPLIDSSASNVTKKVTFANLKSALLKLTGYAKATTAAAVAATDSVSTAIGKLEKKVDDHSTDLNNKVSRNFINNWYFLNPINQRAVSGTITTLGYFIDRWKLISGSVTLTNKGLTLNGTIVQILETAVGTNVIASVKMYSGTANASYDNGTKTFTVTSSGGTINSVKLEIGEVSTLAYDPPMDFGKELAVCQRYYETSWSADLPLQKNYHGFTLLYGRQLQTYLEANFPFKTPKRVTPVMSIFSYNMTPNTVSRDDSSRSDAASPNAVAAYGTTGFVHLIFSAGAITDGERYGCKWIADADL